MTDGRGPDSVLDAVGMEAHGSPVTTFVQKAVGLLPRAVAAPLMETAGVDRLGALYSAIDIVRRGGTISLSGVYGGVADPIPMLTLFDKQIQLRMGQCNIKRWIPEIMPLLTDADPLGCDTFATHRVPLSQAPGDVPQVPEEGRRRREGAAQARAVRPAVGTAIPSPPRHACARPAGKTTPSPSSPPRMARIVSASARSRDRVDHRRQARHAQVEGRLEPHGRPVAVRLDAHDPLNAAKSPSSCSKAIRRSGRVDDVPLGPGQDAVAEVDLPVGLQAAADGRALTATSRTASVYRG